MVRVTVKVWCQGWVLALAFVGAALSPPTALAGVPSGRVGGPHGAVAARSDGFLVPVYAGSGPVGDSLARLDAGGSRAPVDGAVSDETSPQDFVAALRGALKDPAIVVGSTTPLSPLITTGNRLLGFADGTTEVIAAVGALITQARHEVLLQIYEWEDPDESAQWVLAALEARVAGALAPGAMGPLVIRLLLDDSWPAFDAKHRDRVTAFVRGLRAQPLAAHGVHVELASFPGVAWGILHSKTVIADGRRGFVFTGNFKTAGGMARDFYNMGMLVEGRVAETLRDDWLSARHTSVRLESAGPEPEVLAHMDWLNRGDSSVVVSDRGACSGVAGFSPALAAGACPGVAGFSPTLAVIPEADLSLTAAVLTRRASARRHGAARNGANPQARGLLALLAAARQRVEVLNPALNVPEIMDAVVDAVAQRGVGVDLVLSLNMDRRSQRYLGGGDNARTAHALYGALLRRGGSAAADRLRVFWASSDGRTVAGASDAGNVHAKTWALDDSCVWVGSMNWDQQSWIHSRELSVVLCGDAVVSAWRTRIFAPRLERAVPIRAEDLPRVHRWNGDPVFRYLRHRGWFTDRFATGHCEPGRGSTVPHGDARCVTGPG